MSELPRYTKIVRNAWYDKGNDPTSAMFHETDRGKCLFLNYLFYPDWPYAYFASVEIAKVAAASLEKSGAFAVGEVPHFATEPDYMIDDSGPVVYLWVNAHVPQEGEARYNSVVAAGKADMEFLEAAKNATSTEAIRAIAEKDRLRKKGMIPTFPTNDLKMTEGEGYVARLLSRLNIR